MRAGRIQKILPVILGLSLIGAAVYCDNPPPSRIQPRGVAGVIDLREWNLESRGPVNLNGEWEFYWHRLINPAEFSGAHAPRPDGFITLPGAWNEFILNGRELPGEGYATYRLRVLVKENGASLAFKILNINTAFELFVNGILSGSAGVVGADRSSMKPAYFTGVMHSHSGGGTIEVVLRVSNYHLVRGGAWEIIQFGTEGDIRDRWENGLNAEVFLIGSFTIIGIYLLGFFIIVRRGRSPLFLGLFCLCIAVFSMMTGSRYFIHLFPTAPWELTFRILCLSVFLSIPVFALFLYSLYPREMHRSVLIALVGSGLLFGLSCLHPLEIIASQALKYFQFIILGALGYMFYVLVISVRRKREAAYMTLIGAIILFLAAVNDILQDQEILNAYYNVLLLPTGLFVFILSQGYLITIRFSGAFKAEERLMSELKNKSDELIDANWKLDRDIVTIKRAEAELQYTKNFLNSVFNSLSSMLISVDSRGIITQWNRAAEKYTGIPANVAISKELWEVIPFMSEYRDMLGRVVASNNTEELSRAPVAGEDKRYLNIAFSPLVFNGTEGAVIRMDDVTEFAKKDEQLRQAQKMETIGNLVSGLSHDFNNVLVGITGTVSLMNYQIEKGDFDVVKLREDIRIIEESAGRAMDMVNNLLTLSRKHDLSFEPVDLNVALKNIMRICSNTFDKSIELAPVYFPERALVKADPTQIEQVILNLCVNASHAMTFMRKHDQFQGGTLSVAIERIHADRHFCAMHPEAREGDYFLIRHTDTGVGMEPRILPKIFDPFFSTKRKEKGSGLGLTMVYNIIQQHGGFIDVYSEPGAGSTFNVFLPELKDYDGVIPVKEISAEEYGGSGLILVVDDEEIMRQTAKSILAECGYDVITASDGVEGLEVFRARRDDISLVLLDMIMPRKSGGETYLEMKKIRPDIKVVLTSGFKHDHRVKEALQTGINGFIRKPFTMTDLAKIIKEILSG